jgi:hypothetical protein
MKQEHALVQLEEQARFYISTPERAAEALLFCKRLKTLQERIEASVKERAVKIMDDKNMELLHYSVTDPDTGEIREWEVRRSYGTQTKEYRPEKVVEALGLPVALKFFKVGKTALEKYLKKGVSKGDLQEFQAFKAVEDPIIKTKKGSGVIMREVKA